MAEKIGGRMPANIWEAYKSNVLELARLKGFQIYGCNGCQLMFPDYGSSWAHGYAHKIKSLLEGGRIEGAPQI